MSGTAPRIFQRAAARWRVLLAAGFALVIDEASPRALAQEAAYPSLRALALPGLQGLSGPEPPVPPLFPIDAGARSHAPLRRHAGEPRRSKHDLPRLEPYKTFAFARRAWGLRRSLNDPSKAARAKPQADAPPTVAAVPTVKTKRKPKP